MGLLAGEGDAAALGVGAGEAGVDGDGEDDAGAGEEDCAERSTRHSACTQRRSSMCGSLMHAPGTLSASDSEAAGCRPGGPPGRRRLTFGVLGCASGVLSAVHYRNFPEIFRIFFFKL